MNERKHSGKEGIRMKNDFLLQLSDIDNETPEYLETLFALSNGHLGVRASFPILKANKQGNPGSFINGFYDTHPITYGEWAYGYAQKHQTMVKLPSFRDLVFDVNGERSDESQWKIQRKEFALDMYTGILLEQYVITTQMQEQFTFTMRSFVSLSQSEIYAVQYQLSDANFAGEILIEKAFHFKKEPNVALLKGTPDPRVANSRSQLFVESASQKFAELKTQNSQQSILLGQMSRTTQGQVHNEALYSKISFMIEPNIEVTGENFVICSTILTSEDAEQTQARLEELWLTLDYEELAKQQTTAWADFWRISDIQIEGQPDLQKGLRFNLFHLFQNAGRDGKTNFAAKGLTGEGYEGHYFWDTEMYILPFFIYTQPQIAKALLQYRCQILPQAQQRAQVLSQKGALFAWRTINGEEASAYYPAGTAQIHINADISYAFQLYEKVTGDSVFIQEQGAEVIFETARFWLAYGNWSEIAGKQQFCIYGVTGPDEYTALVNNNYYTNKMAQNNLRYAAELAKRTRAVSLEEQQTWLDAAEHMYLPYDEDRQLIKQDDSFLDKAVWPFAETPKENYPLLLHYHPMVIYKYQVSKQADGLLAELLFPQDYSKEQIKRDYHYYEAVTTHDSSLSRSIFSILASRTDQKAKSYRYFMDTALMDLTDLQGNVKDGIHAANMGGSWLSMIYGFAGLAPTDAGIIMENHLPAEIASLTFSLRIRGNLIRVHLTQTEITAEILNKGQNIRLENKPEHLVIYLNEQ
jgi:alpha,alpha-trehalose phosphorylase